MQIARCSQADGKNEKRSSASPSTQLSTHAQKERGAGTQTPHKGGPHVFARASFSPKVQAPPSHQVYWIHISAREDKTISSVPALSVVPSTPSLCSFPRPLPHPLSSSISISILSLFSFSMPVISDTLSLPWPFHLSPSLPLCMAGWVGLPQPSSQPANEQRSL